MPVAATMVDVGSRSVCEGAEHVAADVGDPERGVAERLQLGGGVADLAGVAVPQLATPDADAPELHATFLRSSRRYAPTGLPRVG